MADLDEIRSYIPDLSDADAVYEVGSSVFALFPDRLVHAGDGGLFGREGVQASIALADINGVARGSQHVIMLKKGRIIVPLSAKAWKFTNGKEAGAFVDAVEVAAGRAKRSVTVVASPLPARFQAIVEQNLKDGESVLAALAYGGAQGMVATNRRVLVIKLDAAAGSTFGAQKVKSWAYHAISGVEVSYGFATGRVQLTVPGSKESSKRMGLVEAARSEDMVEFGTVQQKFDAQHLASVIEEQVDRSKRPQEASAHGPRADVAASLERLAALRAAGVLTDAEFATAKARVLSGG